MKPVSWKWRRRRNQKKSRRMVHIWSWNLTWQIVAFPSYPPPPPLSPALSSYVSTKQLVARESDSHTEKESIMKLVGFLSRCRSQRRQSLLHCSRPYKHSTGVYWCGGSNFYGFIERESRWIERKRNLRGCLLSFSPSRGLNCDSLAMTTTATKTEREKQKFNNGTQREEWSWRRPQW